MGMYSLLLRFCDMNYAKKIKTLIKKSSLRSSFGLWAKSPWIQAISLSVCVGIVSRMHFSLLTGEATCVCWILKTQSRMNEDMWAKSQEHAHWHAQSRGIHARHFAATVYVCAVDWAQTHSATTSAATKKKWKSETIQIQTDSKINGELPPTGRERPSTVFNFIPDTWRSLRVGNGL